jgi:hypothetical protein
MNSEVVNAALWRSVVANINTNSLLFIGSAIIATLVAIHQTYGPKNTFFVGSVLILVGVLIFGLNLFLYINWLRRNNSLPDLITPFSIAFSIGIIIVTGIYSSNSDLFSETKNEKIKYLQNTPIDNIVAGIIMLLGFVNFIDGTIRSDNIFMIAPFMAIAYTIATLITDTGTGYLASITKSDEKEIKVTAYVLSFFFLFIVSTVLMNKFMDKFGFNNKIEKEPATPKSIAQQKKLIVFGLFVITLLIACFLFTKTNAIQARDNFQMWLPPVATLVGSIALSVLAVLIVLFKYDAIELYETFTGTILAFVVLQVGLNRVQWSETTTGFLFVAAALFFLVAGMKSSLISNHTLAIFLFVFGITAGRILSKGNRLQLFAINFVVVILLYQLKIANENDTLLFVTAVFMQSVGELFLQDSATWDQFGQLFSLLLAKTLFLISVRTILTFLSAKYVITFQNLFNGYETVKYTSGLVTVIYTVLASVLIDIILRKYIDIQEDTKK